MTTAQGNDHGARGGRWERWLGVLAAVATVVATILAIMSFKFSASANQANDRADAVQSSAVAVSQTNQDVVSALSVELTQARSAASSAQAAYSSVVAQPPAEAETVVETITEFETTTEVSTVSVTPEVTESEPVAPSANAAPTVYRKGTLTFNENSQSADLDALPSDPQWGRLSASSARELGNFREDGNGLNLTFDYSVSAALFQKATYSTCVNYPNYTTVYSIDLRKAQVGWSICMRSRDDRWALITIKSINPESTTLVADITVWDKE